MKVRDLFTSQCGELDFLWKGQMILGVVILLLGILILLVPAIFVALVAGVTMLAGAGLVGSAWRLRRLQHQTRRVAYVESFEW